MGKRATPYRLSRSLMAVLLLNLFVLALISFVLYRSYHHEHDKATLVADNLSRVLEENLAGFLNTIDLTLLAVIDEIDRQEHGGGIDMAALNAFLARHDARLPEVLGLRVANAHGHIEAAVSNANGSNVNIADRDPFTRLRDDANLGLLISKPIIGRLSPQPMIVLARRRNAPDGSFAGIVSVAVAVRTLSQIFATIDLGPHGAVGLWDNTPALLARYSPIATTTTSATAPSSTLRELIRTAQVPTAYHTPSGVDGIERIFFFRTIANRPLHLVVGIADEDFLAGWWRDVAYLSGIASLFVLASIAASLLIHRAMAALRRSHGEAEAARHHSELILASVGEGICGVDRDGLITFANPAARAMLGWSDGEGIGVDLHALAHHHHADGSIYPAGDCPTHQTLQDGKTRHIPDDIYWRKNGSPLPVSMTVAAVIEGGRITGAVNVFRDIAQRKALEQQLRQSEERFRSMASAAVEAIVTIDAQGRVSFWNAAAETMFGYRAEDIIGQDLHRLVLPDEATPRFQAGFQAFRRSGDGPVVGRTVNGVGVRRDGTTFPVEVAVSALRLDEEWHAVGTVRDVTERQRAEAVMARNFAITEALANILRLSLEDMPLERILDGALTQLLSLPWLEVENCGAIFVADHEHKLLRMAAQNNLSPQICAHCTTLPFGQCLCGQAAATRTVVFADCLDHRHEYTFDGIADHGHYCVPVATTTTLVGVLNVYVSHGHRRDEEEERFLLMVADTLAGIITRKQVEETLRNSEELAKTLLNAPADAAFLLDHNGIILEANEALAARFNTQVADVIGRCFFDMIPPALAKARRTQFEQILSQRQPLHTQDERNGQTLDNRIYPVPDSRGAVAQVAVFSRDVTEQRRAEQAVEKALADLARSNEELQQFAYVASHDLRQPLRMVSSYLSLIERKLGEDISDEMKEFLAFAVDGAKRMDRLIVGLLDYSRAGRGAAPFEPLTLGEAVADALRNLEVAVRETGGHVVVADAPPTILGDRSELIRLFQNLVGNAVKYRAPNRQPEVEIGWRRQDGEWLVWVRDNGIGIAPGDHERAFRIFQRLVPNDTYEGTGIGLAICRKIVEHHGGRIWIESVLGEGSIFFFTLPFAPMDFAEAGHG